MNPSRIPLIVAMAALGGFITSGYGTTMRQPDPLPWHLQRQNVGPEIWSKTQGEGISVCVVNDEEISKEVAAVVAGVAPRVELEIAAAPLIHNDGHGTPPAALIKGILSCVKKKSRVIEVSALVRASDFSRDAEADIRAAVISAQRKGALVVASAGMDSQNFRDVSLPASLPGVVAVNAVTHANHVLGEVGGEQVVLAAPGESIVFNVDGAYREVSGTYLAGAQVAGLAALYLELHPGASPDQTREALLAAAVPLEGVPRLNQGAGIVDARRLIGQ